jgi:uncharacterized protein
MDYEAKLRAAVREPGSLLVTLSGGVDSALLCRVAFEELGPRAVALTALGDSLAGRELEDCRRLAAEIGIALVVERSHELDDPNYAANPVNRCYFCKTELYAIAAGVARREGLAAVAAGINRDDLGDHRPGIDAARERGVRMPFVEAGMGKPEIRALAAKLGLSVAEKPAAACLASRLPYGTAVTSERLRRIEACENTLKDLGFLQCRVRYHDDVARIEVPVPDLPALVAVRERLLPAFHAAGFRYVTLDLAGFRSGSLNEGLPARRLRVLPDPQPPAREG